ncbi:MAG: hypothetical protein CMO30_22125 [Tistrella sp.]|nr:hypothetical protein [Tistrella sp.]MBA77978.1 hypothetical protein [Tistrella sp.]
MVGKRNDIEAAATVNLVGAATAGQDVVSCSAVQNISILSTSEYIIINGTRNIILGIASENNNRSGLFCRYSSVASYLD